MRRQTTTDIEPYTFPISKHRWKTTMEIRMGLSSGTKWKIRSARYIAQAHVPHPLRRQAVHLSFYNGHNFGDALSPIVTEFALGAPVVEGHFAGADISAIGSILDPLERWRNPHTPVVWGSGFIREGRPWRGRDIRPAAVRGKLTRERIAHLTDGPIPLGDPGLLVRRVFPQLLTVRKRYRVSVIPHISEQYDRVPQELLRHRDVHIINVRSDPFRVLEEIASSELVLSSSLHGLVCSDALDVPNCWTPLSDKLEGGAYKFEDYYSAFDRVPRPQDLRDALHDPDALIPLWTSLPGLDPVLDDLLRALPVEELVSRYRR